MNLIPSSIALPSLPSRRTPSAELNDQRAQESFRKNHLAQTDPSQYLSHICTPEGKVGHTTFMLLFTSPLQKVLTICKGGAKANQAWAAK